MNFTSSILYSENFGLVMSYFMGSNNFEFENGSTIYSQKTYDLIANGGVSSGVVLDFIKNINPLLKKYKDHGAISFQDSFKGIISNLAGSEELNEHHRNELEKSIRFVINNCYDSKSSRPQPKQYLRFRGWTGSDYGEIASSFLGNSNVTLNNFKAIIDEYVDLLLKEHADFGSKLYEARAGIEFSNEISFKNSIIHGIKNLSESKRRSFTLGCLEHLDKIGAHIAQTNQEFILFTTVFSSFVDELNLASIGPYVREDNAKKFIEDDIIENASRYVSDILNRGIATDEYQKIRDIYKSTLSSEQCLLLLSGILDGIDKCYKTSKLGSSEYESSFNDAYFSKQQLSEIITSLHIDVATLMKSKSFDANCFYRILSSDVVETISDADLYQSVTYPLSQMHHWKYDDIITHFDYLMKTEGLFDVIDSAKELSERELNSIYSKFLDRDVENVLFKTMAINTILSRLYLNHYAPALLSNIAVDENKLAPVMSNMLFHRTLGADDINIFRKMNLSKIVNDPSCDITTQLAMAPLTNEAIVAHMLDVKLRDMPPVSIQKKNMM